MKRKIKSEEYFGNVGDKNNLANRKSRSGKLKEKELQLINCHICKKIKSSSLMITCCIFTCRESYCCGCLKNKRRKVSPHGFMLLKEKEKTWKCLKCKGRCSCVLCKAMRSSEPLNQNSKEAESLLSHKRPRKVTLLRGKKIKMRTQFPIEEEDKVKQNIIDFDGFQIMECEVDSEDELKDEENSKKRPHVIPMPMSEMNNFPTQMMEEKTFSKPIKQLNITKRQNNQKNKTSTRNKSRNKVKYWDDLQMPINETNNLPARKRNNLPTPMKEMNNLPTPMKERNNLPTPMKERNNLPTPTKEMNNLINMETLVKDSPNMLLNPNQKEKIYKINKETKSNKTLNTSKINPSLGRVTERKPFRPCLICRNLNPNIKAIRFRTMSDIIQTIREFLKQLDINIPSDTQPRRHFQENKANFDSFVFEFINGNLKISNKLGTPKRFCENCLLTKLQEPNGLKIIFETLKDHDESGNLDSRTKGDILKNMERLILSGDMRIWQNMRGANDITAEEKANNIFNKIFHISDKRPRAINNIQFNFNFNPNLIVNLNSPANQGIDELCAQGNGLMDLIPENLRVLLNTISNQNNQLQTQQKENEILINNLIQNANLYRNWELHNSIQYENILNKIANVGENKVANANGECQIFLNETNKLADMFKNQALNFSLFNSRVEDLNKINEEIKQHPKEILKFLTNN